MFLRAATSRLAASYYLTLAVFSGSRSAPGVAALSFHPADADIASRGRGLGTAVGRARPPVAVSARGAETEEPLSTDADVSEKIRLRSLSSMDELLDYYDLSPADDGDRRRPVLLADAEEVSSHVDSNFDAILFDCDGVLYRGTDVVPGAPAALRSLMDGGKRVLFVTNNAGSSRAQLRDKLSELLRLEDGSLSEEQMIGSSYSAARYLQKRLLPEGGGDDGEGRRARRSVHVIGTEGLCDEIRNAGFAVTGGPSDDRPGMSRDELASYHFPEHGGDGVDAVVVGLDNDFNYRKLCIANVLLQRNPEALFVSTNEDAYDLVGADARHLPGNGALVKALEHASRRKAVCVGKPSAVLAELIAEDHGLDPRRTLMVGDRLDTDVRFGLDGGMRSALVLTGCTTVEKLVQLEKGGGRGTEEEPLPCMIFPHMGMMGI